MGFYVNWLLAKHFAFSQLSKINYEEIAEIWSQCITVSSN